MNEFPKAYYKRGGVESIKLDGKRLFFSKKAALNESEEAGLIKEGWNTPLTDCFKAKKPLKARAKAQSKPAK